MRIISFALLLALSCFAGACGSGGETAGKSAGAPVGDPEEAIVGTWIFENEVGKIRYTFNADGRFSSKFDGKFQSFSATGSYDISDAGVTLYSDDMEEEEDAEEMVFLDHDRLLEPDTEVIYRRKE